MLDTRDTSIEDAVITVEDTILHAGSGGEARSRCAGRRRTRAPTPEYYRAMFEVLRRAFRPRRLRKRISATPELTASTPDGRPARVTGVVRLLEQELRGPATGRPCVAFAVRVHEPKLREPMGFEPNTPFDCVELVPFVIESKIGRIVVDSQFAEFLDLAEVYLEKTHDVYWTEFVDRRALSPTSTGAETLVVEGETITIVGTSLRRQSVPGKESGFRESPVQLCLIGDFDHPVLLVGGIAKQGAATARESGRDR